MAQTTKMSEVWNDIEKKKYKQKARINLSVVFAVKNTAKNI